MERAFPFPPLQVSQHVSELTGPTIGRGGKLLVHRRLPGGERKDTLPRGAAALQAGVP